MHNILVHEPVFVFTIVTTVIFLAPYLARLSRLPEIACIILSGVLLGPGGFNVLERDGGIQLFGTVGVLFLMFSSSLEIDIREFKKKKYKSLVFGILTFVFPFSIGFLSGKILGFSTMTAVLFGSIFSSHTLLTYPTVIKNGLKDDEATVVAVGGTFITNIVSMFILAIISAKSVDIDAVWWEAPILFICFATLMIIFVSNFARWFFMKASADGFSQYIFIIAMLFTSISLGKLLGMEPVISAFLIGLALNRIVPHNSVLSNRIDFIGRTLFIPFFLIYIGMLMDLRLLFTDIKVIGVALLMLIASVPTKYLAALITKKILKYNKKQMYLIFGLSNTQAANTLAVILVGVHLGLFPQYLLDSAILLMLITCVISAIYTERAGGGDLPLHPQLFEGFRVLVLLANPKTLIKLVDLALYISPKPQGGAGGRSPSPCIYPLALVIDGSGNAVAKEIEEKKKLLSIAQAHAVGAEQDLHLITRVDVNVASGVHLASKEFDITHTVIGWNSSQGKVAKVFGSVLEHVLEMSDNVIIAAKVPTDWSAISEINIVMPPDFDREYGFDSTVKPILNLENSLKKPVKTVDIAAAWSSGPTSSRTWVIFNCRKSSVKHNSDYEKLANYVDKHYPEDNLLLVYPPAGDRQQL